MSVSPKPLFTAIDSWMISRLEYLSILLEMRFDVERFYCSGWGIIVTRLISTGLYCVFLCAYISFRLSNPPRSITDLVFDMLLVFVFSAIIAARINLMPHMCHISISISRQMCRRAHQDASRGLRSRYELSLFKIRIDILLWNALFILFSLFLLTFQPAFNTVIFLSALIARNILSVVSMYTLCTTPLTPKQRKKLLHKLNQRQTLKTQTASFILRG